MWGYEPAAEHVAAARSQALPMQRRSARIDEELQILSAPLIVPSKRAALARESGRSAPRDAVPASESRRARPSPA
jgi:hypothetical protein